LVDRLRGVSEALASQLLWEIAEVARFILTGERPSAQPMNVESRRPSLVSARDGMHYARAKPLGEVILAVEPWLSADAGLETYRGIQKSALGGDNRPLSDRNLSVFRFVVENLPDGEGEPDWAALMARWNTEHTGWSYRRRWEFRQAFDRAAEKLLPGIVDVMPGGAAMHRPLFEDRQR